MIEDKDQIIQELKEIVSSQENEKSTMQSQINVLINRINDLSQPVSIRLNCPECGELHVDEGEYATKPHSTHACQHCGNVWRPAIVNTVGVRFLPGFKNEN